MEYDATGIKPNVTYIYWGIITLAALSPLDVDVIK